MALNLGLCLTRFFSMAYPFQTTSESYYTGGPNFGVHYMKKLGLTQRVEIVSSYNERRDCLDRNWYQLANECGFLPIPLPNLAENEEAIHHYLDSLSVDAIILSGGNSLAFLDPFAGDCAPERDAFEFGIISYCIKNGIPLLGTCRGMQIINCFLGGQLTNVYNHAGTRHTLNIDNAYRDILVTDANSFHNWGIKEDQLANKLTAIARDEQNHIEAFYHQQYRIAGIMWHPERENNLNPKDALLIDRFLK